MLYACGMFKEIDTLRVLPSVTCCCEPDRGCSGYGCWPNLDYPEVLCSLTRFLLDHSRICKLVYHVSGGESDLESLLMASDSQTNVVTLVFEADRSCLDDSAIYLELLKSEKTTHSRLIFCPPQERPWNDHCYDVKLDAPFRNELAIQIATVLARVSYQIDVYIIEGYLVQATDALGEDECDATEDLQSIHELVLQYYILMSGDETTDTSHIQLKTVADYLQEGVTDEVDPRCLEDWRRIHAKAVKAECEAMLAEINEEDDGIWRTAQEYWDGLDQIFQENQERALYELQVAEGLYLEEGQAQVCDASWDLDGTIIAWQKSRRKALWDDAVAVHREISWAEWQRWQRELEAWTPW
jgi:hypothetical protein